MGRGRGAGRGAATLNTINVLTNKTVQTPEFGEMLRENLTPDQLNERFRRSMQDRVQEPQSIPDVGTIITRARETGVAQIPEGVDKKDYINNIVDVGNTIIAPSASLSREVQDKLFQYLREEGNRLSSMTYDYDPEDYDIEGAMLNIGAQNQLGDMLLRIRQEAGSAENLTPKFLADRLNFDNDNEMYTEYVAGGNAGPDGYDIVEGNAEVGQYFYDVRSDLSWIMNGIPLGKY